MAKFLIEIEEGKTPHCTGCPFDVNIQGHFTCGISNIADMEDLDCDKYDMRTLKITKQE